MEFFKNAQKPFEQKCHQILFGFREVEKHKKRKEVRMRERKCWNIIREECKHSDTLHKCFTKRGLTISLF